MTLRVPMPIVFAIILALGLLLNLSHLVRERPPASPPKALGLE